jgi:mucosa-associated lymphoid tissue lymphoma translocation protein 1
MVKIKVAKATTNECSFPKFKIALVICEEKYSKPTQFPPLKATRNDGEALIRVLQELHFQVLAFTNLTLDQMRNAVDLFASFIDEETYALFYYNGHAVGHNEDIYLAAVESSLDEHDLTPLSQVLLHHGHIEAVISDKNPLLGVIIYDSCRDDPKEYVKRKLELSKQSSGYIIKNSSNLIVGYGTMPNMKAFEENDIRTGTQIGMYMKHILNHIHKKDLDIESVFKNVQNDFQKNTAASISEKMKPEYRSSLGQEMYLGANLRQKKATLLQKAFFRLTRSEFLFPPFSRSSALGRFEFPQGIKWNGDDTNISWVHGQVQAENGLDGVLTLIASPSIFFNECEVRFNFNWRSSAPLPQDVNVQLVGRNVQIILRSMYVDKVNGQQHPLETTYQPCSKDRKDVFLTKDGPLFKLKEGTSEYPDSPFVLFGLQDLKDRVKLLLILRTNEQVLVAPGLVCFPLPIMEHTDNLTIKDKKTLYAGIMQHL